MATNIEDQRLLDEWIRAKRNAQLWQAKERDLRIQLAAKNVPEESYGTTQATFCGVDLSILRDLDYKLNAAQAEVFVKSGDEHASLVKVVTSYELNKKEYKKLGPGHPGKKAVDAFLTVKPKLVTVEIK